MKIWPKTVILDDPQTDPDPKKCPKSFKSINSNFSFFVEIRN